MIVEELVGGEVGTCTPETPTVKAAGQMIADDVGSLAVVDDGDLVGIVTERDILRAVAQGKIRSGANVAQIMTPRPDSLEPDVDVREAAQWMMAAGYRHLPVVERGRLIGMISIKDLVWALTEAEAWKVET